MQSRAVMATLFSVALSSLQVIICLALLVVPYDIMMVLFRGGRDLAVVTRVRFWWGLGPASGLRGPG